jgi:tRNA threonylcarbamoyladenosine biosynthesis protein TsaB
MLLAIDTATQIMSLALHDGAELVLERTWHTFQNHTVELAPAVHDVLAQAGQPTLTAMAVSIGPGTYTGLRVGVALAKAMASALNIPLVGLSTLSILAASQSPFQGTLVGVVQAGRARVVTASYQWRKSRWQPKTEPEIKSWEELLAGIEGTSLITGEIDEGGREAIQQAREQGAPITMAHAANRLRRAGFLAEEAWHLLQSKNGDYPAANVIPIYIKTKDSP